MLLVLFQILKCKRAWAGLFLIWTLFSSPTALWAQTNPSNPPDPALSSPDKSQSEPSTVGKVEDSWTFFPARNLFSPLLADPREPSFGMNSYIDEKGFEGSLGGTLEFLHLKTSSDMEWGLGLFGGLWVLTDSPDLSTLLVDDWYSGLFLDERTGAFSFRFEFQDQKSNLGDALREDEVPFYPYSPAHPNSSLYFFTRDNFNLTVSLDATPRLRIYAGGGLKWPWDDFDPYESQTFLFSGLEAYTGFFNLLGSTCRGYGTYHFKYQNQAGGTFNHAVQLGIQWKWDIKKSTALRLAINYYGGHSEFGQFYQQYDQHLGVGLYYDP